MASKFEAPFKWDRPSLDSHPYRPSTPSSLVASSFFSSTTSRFVYIGRQQKQRIPTPPSPTSRVPARVSSEAPPKVQRDLRSETVTGMTFARAMGFDRTKHSPKNQKRDLVKTIPLDFPPYDWREADAKRVESLGYAMDKVGRAPPESPFYASSWRGCAALRPTDASDTPGFYAPGGSAYVALSTSSGRPYASGFGLGKSLAPCRSSLDSRRLNLFAVPKAVGTLTEKVGPGTYTPKDLDKVVLGKKTHGRVVPSPAFLAPKRSEFGGPFRGVDTSGASRRRAGVADGNEEDGAATLSLDPYAMYQNVRPLAAERFLKFIKTDDDFHAHMKRVALEGETEEERKVIDGILGNARDHNKEKKIRGRLASSELLLQDQEDD